MSTKDIENEFDFISRKLEISPEELNKYLSMPINPIEIIKIVCIYSMLVQRR